MITVAVCNSCMQAYSLSIGKDEGHLLTELLDEKGETVSCPRLCGGRINVTPQVNLTVLADNLKPPLHLSGTQLYQAVRGAGLPDEIPQELESLRALFLAYRVVGVDIEETPHGFYVHELYLKNGVVVHLTAGSRGALVLKITKEPP